MKKTTSQRGFSLLEILLTATIVATVLLGIASFQSRSLFMANDTAQKQMASFLLHEISERIRNNPIGALDKKYVTQGVSCSTSPAKMCDVSPLKEDDDGANVAEGEMVGTGDEWADEVDTGAEETDDVDLARQCSPAELAIFDLWLVSCGDDRPTIEGLVNGSLDISCGVDCGGNIPYQISISWGASTLLGVEGVKKKDDAVVDNSQTLTTQLYLRSIQ